ncbi:MAG TPA: hypothetical protein VMG98_00905 [Verrucomicrobiae bacterium]|nr:hypothetical protein [Verrucomicrobiae bacterium]
MLFALLVSPQITDSPRYPTSMPGGTVEFSLAPCVEAKGRVFSDGTVLYSIWNAKWTMQKSFAWNSSDSSPLHQSFRVPPGAYTYEVSATVGTDSSALACTAHYFVAVLPNTQRKIADTMAEGVSDPIPLTYIYGTLPEGAQVVVVKFNGFPKCGDALASMPSKRIEVERDNVGYYAGVPYPATAESPSGKAAVGIIIRSPGNSESRGILVTALLPENVVALTPNAVRLDITSETMAKMAMRPSSTLFCL